MWSFPDGVQLVVLQYTKKIIDAKKSKKVL